MVLPLAPVLLALRLEAAGFRFRAEGRDLLVSPFEQLSEADRTALRRWRHHVLALLAYEPAQLPGDARVH